MPRRYDSSARKRLAAETRRRILDAAVALHARGIDEVRPLAAAAGVSVPTVRKHFPTKEAIFEGCTEHFFRTFDPPALAGAARARDPRDRIARVVAEMCRAHEATHLLNWHASLAADASPALSAALERYATLVDLGVDAILDGEGISRGVAASVRPRLRALLDTLTYRAFRVHAGLGVEAARDELIAVVTAAAGFPSTP